MAKIRVRRTSKARVEKDTRKMAIINIYRESDRIKGYAIITLNASLFFRRLLSIHRMSCHRYEQHAGNQLGGVVIPVFGDQGQVLI